MKKIMVLVAIMVWVSTLTQGLCGITIVGHPTTSSIISTKDNGVISYQAGQNLASITGKINSDLGKSDNKVFISKVTLNENSASVLYHCSRPDGSFKKVTVDISSNNGNFQPNDVVVLYTKCQ